MPPKIDSQWQACTSSASLMSHKSYHNYQILTSKYQMHQQRNSFMTDTKRMRLLTVLLLYTNYVSGAWSGLYIKLTAYD